MCNLFQLIGGGMCHLFILISHLYIHELRTKHTQEKNLDPRNTHEIKIWTHEIKYPQEKILDPRNTHMKNFLSMKYPPEKNSDARRHDNTRPTVARDPRKLANSIYMVRLCCKTEIFTVSTKNEEQINKK